VLFDPYCGNRTLDLLKAANSIIMPMFWRGTAADNPEQIEGGGGFHITRNPRAFAII